MIPWPQSQSRVFLTMDFLALLSCVMSEYVTTQTWNYIIVSTRPRSLSFKPIFFIYLSMYTFIGILKKNPSSHTPKYSIGQNMSRKQHTRGTTFKVL